MRRFVNQLFLAPLPKCIMNALDEGTINRRNFIGQFERETNVGLETDKHSSSFAWKRCILTRLNIIRGRKCRAYLPCQPIKWNSSLDWLPRMTLQKTSASCTISLIQGICSKCLACNGEAKHERWNLTRDGCRFFEVQLCSTFALALTSISDNLDRHYCFGHNRFQWIKFCQSLGTSPKQYKKFSLDANQIAIQSSSNGPQTGRKLLRNYNGNSISI